MTRLALLACAAAAFAALATANSGGYRYGVSDQAFYQPAVARALDPSLFPRDAPLIESQSRLMLADDVMAWIARATGLDLPPLFLAMYGLTLLGLAAASVAYARASGLSWWAAAAFLLLLTFRHRIAKTGANSLEGYMHPRELAFACGAAALAGIAGARYARAAVWTALAAVLHPTTALWFAIVLAVAAGVDRRAWRSWLVAGAAVGAIAGLWALTAGPLAGRLVAMDPVWLSVLAEKDYLFPTAWPAYAWLANLGYAVVIGLIYRRRVAQDVVSPGERGLMAGLVALVGVFVVSVPLTALKMALAVQLQVTRVFWLLDYVTAAYVAWWLTTSGLASARRVRIAVLAVLLALSVSRGVYQLNAAVPARQLATVSLPDTPWIEAMTWLSTQPRAWHVLADPGHAWKYGFSVRVAAARDTLLESGKDSAIAMYDRDVAQRVADRTADLADFEHLTAATARALAAKYHLDVAVVENTRVLDLPELHHNAQFTIYDLR